MSADCGIPKLQLLEQIGCALLPFAQILILADAGPWHDQQSALLVQDDSPCCHHITSFCGFTWDVVPAHAASSSELW